MLADDDPTSWSGAIGLMVGVGVVIVMSGWVVIWVAQRAADGRLGPNRWAGVRTRATRSSEEAWLAAHREARGPSVLGGRAAIVGSVVAVPIGLLIGAGDAGRAVAAWGTTIGTVIALMTALVVYGAWRGHRVAKLVAAGEPRP